MQKSMSYFAPGMCVSLLLGVFYLLDLRGGGVLSEEVHNWHRWMAQSCELCANTFALSKQCTVTLCTVTLY